MANDNGPSDDSERRIHVGEAADGRDVWLPVERILTGRAFATGKSGSGKSNTASVIVEELLEGGYAVLIVDTDGEYYGLKEEYELLHAGADEECDVQVGVEHAEKLATLALEQNVPVILDVSGFLDEDEADELLRETARHLFAKEKKLKRPFLLVVEEIHEYIPEGAGMGETGKMLIKVGKRGRKHGLGILGISQRPADVKKDFITQANWLVWHRLTWENDTKVVQRIVGSEYGDAVSKLDDGEAFAQFDWTERDVQRIQFKRKRTFDAGATPGLDDFERPDLKSVSDGLMDDLSSISEQKQREQDRIEELEEKLQRKEARIDELQRERDRAKEVSTAAEQVADAVAEGMPDSYQARLGAKNEEIDRLHGRVAELEARIEEIAMAVSEDDTVDATLPEFETGGDDRPDLFEDYESIETYLETARDESGTTSRNAGGGAADDSTGSDPTSEPIPTPDPSALEGNPSIAERAATDDAPGKSKPSAEAGSTGTALDEHFERTDDWPDPDAPMVSGPTADGDAGDDSGPLPDASADEGATPAPTADAGSYQSTTRSGSEPTGSRSEAGDAEDPSESRTAGTAPGSPAAERPTGDGTASRTLEPPTTGEDATGNGSSPPTTEEGLLATTEGDGIIDAEAAESDSGTASDDTPGDDAGDSTASESGDGGGSGEIVVGGPTTGDEGSGSDGVGESEAGSDAVESADDRARSAGTNGPEPDADRLAGLLTEPAVATKLQAAVRESQCNEKHARTILAALATEAPVALEAVTEIAGVGPEATYSLLAALRARNLVIRDSDLHYALDVEGIERIVETADDRAHLGELRKQWNIG
jgi:prefoldin subunit 5